MNPIPDHFYTGDDTNNNFVGLRENYYAWKWGDALLLCWIPIGILHQNPMQIQDGDGLWEKTI